MLIPSLFAGGEGQSVSAEVTPRSGGEESAKEGSLNDIHYV